MVWITLQTGTCVLLYVTFGLNVLVAPIGPALAHDSRTEWILNDNIMCPYNNEDAGSLDIDCVERLIVIRKAHFSFLNDLNICSSSVECSSCGLLGTQMHRADEIWSCNGEEFCSITYADIMGDRFDEECECMPLKLEVEFQCVDEYNVYSLSDVCHELKLPNSSFVITSPSYQDPRLLPCEFSFDVREGYQHIVDIEAINGLAVSACPTSELSECQQVSGPTEMTFRGPGRLTVRSRRLPFRRRQWLTLNYKEVTLGSSASATTASTSIATPTRRSSKDMKTVIAVSIVITLALVTSIGIVAFILISRKRSKRPPVEGPRVLGLNQLRRRRRPNENEYTSSVPTAPVPGLPAEPRADVPRPQTSRTPRTHRTPRHGHPAAASHDNRAHTAASSDNEDSDNENFETIPDVATLRDIRSRHSDVTVDANTHDS